MQKAFLVAEGIKSLGQIDENCSHKGFLC